MLGVAVLSCIGAGLATLGIIESRVHRRRMRSIPIRIHVNGTRGKSSVTRLIAAGLRAGGVRTVAKTTGTLPRLILPNGRELPIYRPSRPNVLEQMRTVAQATSRRADALVIECMALQPQLQWLSEARMVGSTHGVITNVRPDHLDVMGPTEDEVALALAGTVPIGGTLFTTEHTHLPVLRAAADDRSSRVRAVTPEEVENIDESILSRFSYREHADNVALALVVCAELGVPRDVALDGMQRARPDPGAMTEHRLEFFGRRILFLNAFAANDPVSSESIWRDALSRHHDREQTIAIFNCRADRSDRSVQLAESYARWPRADWLVLIGTGTWVFAKRAVNCGVAPDRIVFVEHPSPDEIFEVILALIERSALVVGLGNVADPGLSLVSYFANRAQVHRHG